MSPYTTFLSCSFAGHAVQEYVSYARVQRHTLLYSYLCCGGPDLTMQEHMHDFAYELQNATCKLLP